MNKNQDSYFIYRGHKIYYGAPAQINGEWFYGYEGKWLQSLHTTITFCEVSL